MSSGFTYQRESGKSVSFTGGDALKEVFKKLPDDVRRKVTTKALKLSAEEVKAQAITNCPKDENFLVASIRIKTSRKRNDQGSYDQSASIVAGDWRAWYAHLMEWGFMHSRGIPKGSPTEYIYEKGRGRRKRRSRPTRRGFVDGKAFMRNAIEQKFEPMLNHFSRELAEQAEKAFSKIKK